MDIKTLMDYELANSWVGHLPAWGWLDSLASKYLALKVRNKYETYLKWKKP